MKKYLFLFVAIALIYPVVGFGQEKKKRKIVGVKNNEMNKSDSGSIHAPKPIIIEPNKSSEISYPPNFNIRDTSAIGTTGEFFLQPTQTEYRYQRKYGIVNKKGGIVLPLIFDEIIVIGDNDILVKQGKLFALYDQYFKMKLPLEYLEIAKIRNTEYYQVQELNKHESYRTIIDKNENALFKNNSLLIIPFMLFLHDRFSNTKSKYFKIIDTNTQKYGIFDAESNSIILPIEYDEIKEYEKSLVVYKDKTCNLLNIDLKPVFKSNITAIQEVSSNVFLIYKDGQKGICNNIGNILIQAEYSDIECIYGKPLIYIVKKNGKQAILNNQGRILIPFEYQKIICDELYNLPVKNNGKWGLIDTSGKKLLPCIYDTLIVCKNSVIVKMNNQINKLNLETGDKSLLNIQNITTFKYSTLRPYNSATYITTSNGKFGIIGNNFEVILPNEYDSIVQLEIYQSFYLIYNKGKVGLANSSGIILYQTQYEKIFQIPKRTELLLKYNNKYGVGSYDGKVVIPCDYDYISPDYQEIYERYFCVKNNIVTKKNGENKNY